MAPTQPETPLRRSEVGAFRTPIQPPPLNDDEEERRQRRRTALEDSSASSTIEDNETLKNCIKICNENKLSKENAWSVSVIDTLSKLLDKHHKALNNFKVAGSSLEVSSKVYGLRVDSIHTDVMRLSAGLNKRKFTEQNDDENGQDNNTLNDTQQPQNKDNQNDDDSKQKRKKRKKKLLSTITKNKDTINAKLDTHPFTDPIFAKLNSIGGSINSSGRLLQNILPSTDSEIMLRMDYQFWDSKASSENLIMPNENDLIKEYENLIKADISTMESIDFDNLNLRKTHSGYIICDTPAEVEVDNQKELPEIPNANEDPKNDSQLAMAFDINAEVEPIPPDPGFMDVDMNDLDDLTADEQLAITHCRALRRRPDIIEDMRPLDSTSANLEYSYRPVNKISQFWAGPSHWKFKKSTHSLSMQQRLSHYPTLTNNFETGTTTTQNQKKAKRNKRGNKLRGARDDEEIEFDLDLVNEDLFLNINDPQGRKLRKVNIQKKWDPKKLKLPTDLQIDHNIFDVYEYAPGLRISRIQDNDDDTIPMELPIDDRYDYNNPIDREYCPNVQMECDSETDTDRDMPLTQNCSQVLPSQGIEIATDFHGAPDKITRIVVPYAKRAKIIDMKQLKKCCLHIIKTQLSLTNEENFLDKVIQENNNNINKNDKNDDINVDNNSLINDNNNDDVMALVKTEKYKNGVATFKQIYNDLPQILSNKMNDALSVPVAFYSILHLANETNLRLIPQNDLKDFKILQLDN